MAQLKSHVNVVGIIGVVSIGKPAMLLVDYCEHGSLLSFLKKKSECSRVEQLFADQRLTAAADVARGMAYLGELPQPGHTISAHYC